MRGRLGSLADPRHFQLAMLGGLFVYGQLALDFGVPLPVWVPTLLVALATQALLARSIDGAPFEPRSALISGLSLCLLLRSEVSWLVPLAAFVAIASKFLLRWNGKHVWNPTAFAIVVMLVGSNLGAWPASWVSPGQWGSTATGVFVLAGLGSLVVFRAERSDVTWAFLAATAALVFGRALLLGDPLRIPLHQLSGGALWIFAFFMISDPRTTPASRRGRIAFAVAVAAEAAWGRFVLWEPTSLFYALVGMTPLVVALDRWFPGASYEWPASRRVEAAPELQPAAAPQFEPVPIADPESHEGDPIHVPASPRLDPGRPALWGDAR